MHIDARVPAADRSKRVMSFSTAVEHAPAAKIPGDDFRPKLSANYKWYDTAASRRVHALRARPLTEQRIQQIDRFVPNKFRKRVTRTRKLNG